MINWSSRHFCRHKHVNVIVFYDLLLGVEVVDLWRHSSKCRNHLRLRCSLKVDNWSYHRFDEACLISKGSCLQLSFGRGDGLGNLSNQLWTLSSFIGHLVRYFTKEWNSVRMACSLTDWRSYSSSEECLLVLVDLLMHPFSISKNNYNMNGQT